ncbi:hypothetical protein HYX12_02085, partial [Candidatus Woesearchaeota archaeon]|nr:hypothetical protein [Candidatus Woesearchaeota archaeon]
MAKKKWLLVAGLIAAIGLGVGMMYKRIAVLQAERQEIHQRINQIEAGIQAWKKKSALDKIQGEFKRIQTKVRKIKVHKYGPPDENDEEFEKLKEIEQAVEDRTNLLLTIDTRLSELIDTAAESAKMLKEFQEKLKGESSQRELVALTDDIYSKRFYFEQQRISISNMRDIVLQSIGS